ncbi:KLP1 [Symbiodinium sp. KB8]|nr:KLP1 [Symbiodinium sp. KB8]
MEGYNGCLLAYGQTGAGKTHTMSGPDVDDDELKGIIPRVGDAFFNFAAEADESVEFAIKCSYVEIYMERICDLLVHEDPNMGVYIADCTEVYVTSRDEMLEVMKTGNANRKVAATGMNEGSSRSHSLFVVTLIQKNTETGLMRTGKFYMVDLAGSETVNKTGATGQTLEEAKKINQSLSALGNVINALTDSRMTHVPYRDSKLTRVLQEALGGNSQTALIINCSPSSYNEAETLSTLRFGKRAKRVKNRAVVNKELSPEQMKK